MPRNKGRRIQSHRKPPRPLSWDSPRGNCRLCGGPIIDNGKQNFRKNWHGTCALRWRLANNPADARAYVLKRDNLTCQRCGIECTPRQMHIDHIKPLFEAAGDLSYYEVENQEALCIKCHKEKTKDDMDLWRKVYKPLDSKKNPNT